MFLPKCSLSTCPSVILGSSSSCVNLSKCYILVVYKRVSVHFSSPCVTAF